MTTNTNPTPETDTAPDTFRGVPLWADRSLCALGAAVAVAIAAVVLALSAPIAPDAATDSIVTSTDDGETHVVEGDRIGVEYHPTVTVYTEAGDLTRTIETDRLSEKTCAVGDTATVHDSGAVTCTR